jgi:dihydroorotase-like cyclic amidohydrolase
VNQGRLSLDRLIHLLARKPAEIFQLKGGSIQEGNIADLVIVDMNQEYRIDPSTFHSKAKYSPFEGYKVKGKPVKTFVGGQLVYDSGEIVTNPGSGTVLN